MLENYVEAYAWLSLATAKGRPPNLQREATRLKKQIRRKMSAEQLAEAQKRASRLWERIESSKSD